ncbi:Cpe/LpqF family protein [Microbacterium proteolyticum]|uniref:Cpe/LpqF family protein n=1 Tax=Microbacterium proteolyticum TaxID=1572644 RepID=UPI001FABA38A|nr:Cpe/LpqF family protein [Microbacterium proteolyticum]MCI9859183.1 Cpe/LpqF family protein [Microbacterium proteolyticum]
MTLARRLAAALSFVAVAALTACTSAAPDTPASAAASVEVPSTPVGERVTWIIDVLEAEADTTASEWARVLHEDFRSQVSAEDVAELLNRQIRPAAPFTVTAYQGTETQAVATLAGSVGDPFDLSLSIDGNDRITGMVFGPVAAPWEPSTSWEELEQRLRELPGEVSALVRHRDADVVSIDPDRSAPLASVFKLYVLLAVADAVASGDLAWDETLVLGDTDRSLPSGELQDAPTGTEVSVREAASAMIRISDNTATDLLIGRLGRERVEAAVARSGHADPSALTPFLSTKELFTLGYGDAAVRSEWDAADDAGRRALLARIDAAPLAVAVADVTTPVWQQGFEWFASSADVAAVHRALQETQDAEVLGILSENPGQGLDVGSWPYVAFKGGSSRGVVTGSWFVRDEASEATVVLMMADADVAAVSAATPTLFHLAEDALRLAR